MDPTLVIALAAVGWLLLALLAWRVVQRHRRIRRWQRLEYQRLATSNGTHHPQSLSIIEHDCQAGLEASRERRGA